MGKMSKGMVRWQLLSMRIYVVLSGRHFKVGRAFFNLIFLKLGLEVGEVCWNVVGLGMPFNERMGGVVVMNLAVWVRSAIWARGWVGAMLESLTK